VLDHADQAVQAGEPFAALGCQAKGMDRLGQDGSTLDQKNSG
jgi:hypothetical protein